MRDIKATYNHLLKLKVKQQNVISKLEKIDALSDELQQNILAVRSSDELDHLVFSLTKIMLMTLTEKRFLFIV